MYAKKDRQFGYFIYFIAKVNVSRMLLYYFIYEQK